MRHCITSMTLLLLASLQSYAEQETTLRVMTYNIHHGAGIDGKLDLARLGKVIAAENAHVVCLQEVDNRTTRSQKVDQAKQLAKQLGMQFRFASNLDFQGGGYGLAILSQHPILQHTHSLLPDTDGGEQRGVLSVTIKPPDAAPILISCTHFDHRRPNQQRINSAKQINAMTMAHPAMPAILAGDLNAERGTPTLDILEDNWSHPTQKVLPTIPVTRPTKQIDFVLYRPQHRWKTASVRVLAEAIASDHRALIAELKLQPPSKESP